MIFTIPRVKANRLLDELAHTTRQDDYLNLHITLLATTGDLKINTLRPEGMSLYEAFHFFDDVGMLD